MFSCEFYEVSKNTFFYRTRLVAAYLAIFQHYAWEIWIFQVKLLNPFIDQFINQSFRLKAFILNTERGNLWIWFFFYRNEHYYID